MYDFYQCSYSDFVCVCGNKNKDEDNSPKTRNDKKN